MLIIMPYLECLSQNFSQKSVRLLGIVRQVMSVLQRSYNMVNTMLYLIVRILP